MKQAADDPEFPKRRAASALAKFMQLHEYNLAQKTEVIVEHFRNNVRHQMGGKAKAMVVTSGRLHAVRYMQAFQRYIGSRDTTTCGRWWLSAARCAIRTRARSSPSRA